MGRALASTVTLALLVAPLAACPAGDDDGPDATPGDTGLAVTWATASAVPGPADTTHRVDELTLRFSSVRAIGDAAPGDPRASTGALELAWNDDGAPPAPLVFDHAPAGLYSRLELGVGGADEAFELHGSVLLGATWTPFELEDEAPLAISVPTSAVVAPGVRATIAVTLDVAAVLAPIDFTRLPSEAGVLVLHREDPQIDAVRAALATALSASSPPQ